MFFDRSWYNRAVVEPVNDFCTQEQYERFMQQVPEFEHMLFEDGVILVKFWFSISREVQFARFDSRRKNPLKQWKLSPLDEQAQDLWDAYTRYKEADVQPHAHQLQPVDHRQGQQQAARAAREHPLRAVA